MGILRILEESGRRRWRPAREVRGPESETRERRAIIIRETESENHPGVLDIRGRRDFSRFDPSPGKAPL